MAHILRRALTTSCCKTRTYRFSNVVANHRRLGSTYPIDDIIFGLNDEQKQVVSHPNYSMQNKKPPC